MDVLDILMVACLIYWILRLIRGTRAVYMLVGLAMAVAIYRISQALQLNTLSWILSNFFGSLLLVIVVVFQNDIRRVLTQVGRTRLFSGFGFSQESELVEELVRTSVSLANKKIGALIVLERNADVSDYVEIGVKLDGVLSKEIMTSIFLPTSPIHDGAILIQKGRITAAGCFLPLTLNPQVGTEYGTRHRAAIGLTEETDAVVIVISEEKGWVSLVSEGRVTRGLDAPGLRKMLLEYFNPGFSSVRRFRRFLSHFGGGRA